MARRRKGRSAAFMRSINPFLNKRRKKTKRYSTMARKKRYSKKSGFSMNGAIKVLSGAALAAVYEVFVSPMIPLGDMLKNILELVGGIVLAAMPGVPMPVRAMGAALATINAYSLIVPYVSQWASGGASNQGWS